MCRALHQGTATARKWLLSTARSLLMSWLTAGRVCQRKGKLLTCLKAAVRTDCLIRWEHISSSPSECSKAARNFKMNRIKYIYIGVVCGFHATWNRRTGKNSGVPPESTSPRWSLLLVTFWKVAYSSLFNECWREFGVCSLKRCY